MSGPMNAAAAMDTLELAVTPSAQPSSGAQTAKANATVTPTASVTT